LVFSGSEFTDLTNFGNLSAVNGTCRFSNHSNISNLTGLSALTSVGNLSILGNTSLTSLTGLTALNSITGNLVIQFNDALTTLVDFPPVPINWFGIYDNLSLQSLQGLIIESQALRIDIARNSALQDITALAPVTSIDVLLDISGNTTLSNLSGLEQLVDIGFNLKVVGNPALNNCRGICNLLENGTIGGNINISANLTGCNSQPEVLSSCGTPPCEFETDTTFVDITIPCNSKLEAPKVTDICTGSLLCGVPLDSGFYFTQDTYMTEWKFTAGDGTMDTVLQNITVEGIVVCDNISTGIGSLRNALECAEEGDTINIFEGLMNETLVLETEGLTVEENLVIIVDPSDNITIDASMVPSAFIISPGSTLTLDGVQLIMGNAALGGAAMNEGILNILNTVIFPNPTHPDGSQFSGPGEINIFPETTIFPPIED